MLYRNCILKSIAAISEVPLIGMLASKSIFVFYVPRFVLFAWVFRRKRVHLTPLVPFGCTAILALVGPVDLTRCIVLGMF